MLRMQRFNTAAPMMASVAADHHCSCGGSNPIATQRRGIKCHDVREYLPLGMPVEMRFYQRYTTRPDHASGVQFLTHYSDHRRWNVRKDFIDYMNWGREQGQAHLPHRQHRVAFDFHDRVNPTVLPRGASRGNFVGQDPSADAHPDLSTSFNPRKTIYSEPVHMNRAYSEYTPGDVEVRINPRNGNPLNVTSLDARHLGLTSVADKASRFMGHLPAIDDPHARVISGKQHAKLQQVGTVPGRVPGLNAPFLGETDTQHMQAMSQPLTADNRITGNDGRFSKTLYINDPTRSNVLTADLAKNLNEQIDMATNGVYSKLVVLQAAQSGLTDKFSSGMDIEQYSFDMAMATKYEAEAKDLAKDLAAAPTDTRRQNISAKIEEKVSLAMRHRMRVDDALRSQTGLLWRTFTAPRPLMTLINGKCHNTACGMALLAKYPALRDSSEFIVDGPSYGLSPFGGMTNLLARPETSGKVPGLAEYTVLTGNALYAGDALRLGWSDLYTNFSDMDYHIKDWFNASEHMHNDAIAWQLGQLLDKCFKMGEHHSTALERCAVTPIRAKWIEDAFADQKSVEAIVETLTQMERLPTGPSTADAIAAGNNFDVATATPHSLYDVDAGIAKLTKNNLHFALAPWDITPPTAEEVVGFTDNAAVASTAADAERTQSNFAAVFTQYVFERDAKNREVAILDKKDRLRMKAWRKQRYQEYQDYVSMMHQPMKRHVFARVEGCDGKLVNFEFFFDRKKIEEEAAKLALEAAAAAGTTAATAMVVPGASGNNFMVKAVLREVAKQMGYDLTRPLDLGWYMPTLDTAAIRTDDELVKVLQNDPAFEAPSEFPTVHPPIYFIVKRPTLHMSEWAYATKHQLLLSSPFALKASFQLLNDVRTGRAAAAAKAADAADRTELEVAETSIQSISETLATEFRYISRLVKRDDFFKVGFNATRTMNQWEELEADRAVNLHKSDQPTRRPAVDYEDVFARDVTVSGHKFLLRPKWSPATLEEVSDADIAALQAPLNFAKDEGLTEIHVPTYTSKATRVAASINDIGGFEVVPGLGELAYTAKEGSKTTTAEPRVAPLESDAHVPTNVNFYVMARHPWTDQANSWRQDTFTDASLEYMTDKYKDALTQLNKGANANNNNKNSNNNGGNSNYWPSKADVEGDGKFEADEEALLQDRLYNAVDVASNKVEQWASTLRNAAQKQALDYKIEITSQQERFYDDNYYRWFIRPGEHPNPSGLLRNGKAVKVESESSGGDDGIDPETLMASFEENFNSEPVAEAGSDAAATE